MKQTVPPPLQTTVSNRPGGGGDDNKEGIIFADQPSRSNFPSAVPTVQNRFFNQNPEWNDEGYDSEGGLPYFANDEEVDADDYNEAPLVNDACPPPGEAESAVAETEAAPELTVSGVMLLNVAWLKGELKRRGNAIAGKKGELQARLKEAIMLNVPGSHLLP
jgi:hypothetical protein